MNTWLKIDRSTTGVRRIPTNVRSLTGEVNGQEFESSLERDLLLLVHWDHGVEWYQSQPVKIDYTDSKGNARSYTPDLLVFYRTVVGNAPPHKTRKPLLCEVKYREDLIKQRDQLKPKFRAAQDYAKANGYEFRVLTEREIRTEYLKNIQFLWSYRFAPFEPHHYEKLKSVLHELEETDPHTLLEACYSSKTLRGEALWTLWCMVARGWVKCDLHEPLTMKTCIWTEL
ncbi:MAG TPA: TnsA endonuclease N-terminal domain-containing protein [Gallionella sp.]|nr:TnsA endonuclease N-terminal domain-containing protein [Gallionella sp.]